MRKPKLQWREEDGGHVAEAMGVKLECYDCESEWAVQLSTATRYGDYKDEFKDPAAAKETAEALFDTYLTRDMDIIETVNALAAAPEGAVVERIEDGVNVRLRYDHDEEELILDESGRSAFATAFTLNAKYRFVFDPEPRAKVETVEAEQWTCEHCGAVHLRAESGTITWTCDDCGKVMVRGE